MDWSQQIFAYCERGQNGAFCAEPFNAVSNAAFIVASMVALWVWNGLPKSRRGTAELGLIVLVGVIGVGSFLFHTMATRWAQLADVAPIGAFMFGYTAYALRRYLGCSPIAVALGVAVFAGLMAGASAVPCPAHLQSLVEGARCLNGSMGYLPALAMLAAISALMRALRHPGGVLLSGATCVFAVSLTARSLDLELCGGSQFLGAVRGTHAIWHTLNAVTLGLLLLAALRHGARRACAPNR